jgi:hypothetical protein
MATAQMRREIVDVYASSEIRLDEEKTVADAESER